MRVARRPHRLFISSFSFIPARNIGRGVVKPNQGVKMLNKKQFLVVKLSLDLLVRTTQSYQFGYCVH